MIEERKKKMHFLLDCSQKKRFVAVQKRACEKSFFDLSEKNGSKMSSEDIDKYKSKEKASIFDF